VGGPKKKKKGIKGHGLAHPDLDTDRSANYLELFRGRE
jgi:hypothetical protein